MKIGDQTFMWRACQSAFGAFLLLLTSVASAAGVSVELSSTEMGLDGAVLLRVSVDGEMEGQVVPPDVAGLIFEPVGANQHRFNINGRIKVEQIYDFRIRAQKVGQYRIPPVEATIAGQTFRSLPLELNVLRSQAQAQSQTPGAPAAKGSGRKPMPDSKANHGVMLTQDCAKDTVYVGEQLVCKVRIYHRGNLTGGQKKPRPNASFRRFGVDGERRYTEVVDGQRYQVVELTEVVVPSEAGQLELPAYRLMATVLIRDRSSKNLNKFFDRFGGMLNFDFGMSRTEEVEVASNTNTVTVMAQPPIPAGGRDVGLVGEFTVEGKASPTSLRAGETTTITVTIDGKGLVDHLDWPNLDQQNLIGRTYKDQPDYKERLSPELGLRSRKSFRLALVPRAEGTYDLGSLGWWAFNPATGSWQRLQVDYGDLIVTPGEAEREQLAVGAQPLSDPEATAMERDAERRQPVERLSEDLRPLDRESSLTRRDDLSVTMTAGLLALGGLPLLAGFGLAGYAKVQQRRQGRSLGRRHFDLAWKQGQKLRQQDHDQACRVVWAGLCAWVAEDLGELDAAALTPQDVWLWLQGWQLSDDDRQTWQQWLEAWDDYRFGGAASRWQGDTWLDHGRQLVRGLQRRAQA